MRIKILDFLQLTTNKRKLLRVLSEIHTHQTLDLNAEVCIGFSKQSKRLIYHDGRHRAMIKLLGGEEFVDVQLYIHDEDDYYPEDLSWCKNNFETIFGKQCPIEEVEMLVSQFDKEEVWLS